jgi:hypothetical protein
MKSVLIFCITLFALTEADVAMLGVKINAVADYKLDLKVLNRDAYSVKYKTADGNHLSITTESGKVVFMENDWLQSKEANQPLLTNFKFGETSLKDIRTALGTSGFAYREQSYLKSEKTLTTLNCFELESPENVILVLITKAPISSITDKEDVSSFLKLDAVILADKKYLDGIWGKKKTYDPQYKKIKL